MGEQKPTIGRIVHYVAGKVEPHNHYAAIITHVWSDTCVNLTVFPKGDMTGDAETGVKTPVVLDESCERSFCWHWPERS